MGARATRVEWDSYDVLSPENIRIEVKAGGYVQAWTQTRPSGNPSWDIPQTIPFDPETGKYLPEAQRGFQADVYVFAVHEARRADSTPEILSGHARRAAPSGHTTSTGSPAARASSTVSAVPPPLPDGGVPSQTATSRSARLSSSLFAAS